MGQLDDRVHADLLEELDGYDVDGVLQRMPQGGWSAEFSVKIARGPFDDLSPDPGVEADGGVVDDGGRGESPIEGGGIDEWLEGRARLPLCLGGAVEFASLEVVTANH